MSVAQYQNALQLTEIPHECLPPRYRVTPHNVRVYPKSALLCNPAAVTMAASTVAPDGPRSLARSLDVFGPRVAAGGRFHSH